MNRFDIPCPQCYLPVTVTWEPQVSAIGLVARCCDCIWSGTDLHLMMDSARAYRALDPRRHWLPDPWVAATLTKLEEEFNRKGIQV